MSEARLVVVTASTNLDRARRCIESWGDVPLVCVLNGAQPAQIGTTPPNGTLVISAEYLGTVPAFTAGVDLALRDYPDAEVLACLHDDLEILEEGWAEKVVERFQRQPAIGLLGFGGAIGLGDSDIYQKPYAPKQLARIGFRSNLVDAEVHGYRSLLAERVAALDGFSQVGRREFWSGYTGSSGYNADHELDALQGPRERPWHVLADLGLVHHIYDGALGCLAARYGWETWFLPLRCRHYGGSTAVGDEGYQRWAKTQHEGGDHGFWEQGHKAVYEAFRDVLPIRV